MPCCLLMFAKEIILKEQLAARYLFQCSPANCWPTLARWIVEGLPVIQESPRSIYTIRLFGSDCGGPRFCVPFGYLRRGEITTWARDRSRPINVKVTMKTSWANVPRPTNFTQPMFSPTESQKLWNWLHSVFFTRIIFLCKSWTVKTTPEAATRPQRPEAHSLSAEIRDRSNSASNSSRRCC